MTNFTLEAFNPKQHDINTVADLIYRSDEETNSLVYGSDPTAVIAKLLAQKGGYFDPKYTRIAVAAGEIQAVLVAFPVSAKAAIDKASGSGFVKAMGIAAFLVRLPLYSRLNKIMAGDMDRNGYYIHTISVSPKQRGRGLGSQLLTAAAVGQSKIYLHVNTNNHRAVKFYRQNGFLEQSSQTAVHKGLVLRESLMAKTTAGPTAT